MTSQMTKDFNMKSKLRKFREGGDGSTPAQPRMLGSGMAANAGSILQNRGRSIDDAVEAASGGTPAPRPAPQPQQQQQVAQNTQGKSALRRFLGFADGGAARGERGSASQFAGGRTFRKSEEAGPLLGSTMTPAQQSAAAAGWQAASAGQSVGEAAATDALAQGQRVVGDGMSRVMQDGADSYGYADGGIHAGSNGLDGGRVHGKGTPTSDDVQPVALSKKEYVLPADTADAIGRDKLDRLRLETHDFVDAGKQQQLANQVKNGGLRSFLLGGDDIEPPQTATGGGTPPPRGPVPPGGAPNVNPPGGGAQNYAITASPSAAPAQQPIRLPEKNMGPAQVVEDAAKGGSRLRGLASTAAKWGGKIAAPLAFVTGAYNTYQDVKDGRAYQLANEMDWEKNPIGRAGAIGIDYLHNVGNNFGFGLPDMVGTAVNDWYNGDKSFGQSLVDNNPITGETAREAQWRKYQEDQAAKNVASMKQRTGVGVIGGQQQQQGDQQQGGQKVLTSADAAARKAGKGGVTNTNTNTNTGTGDDTAQTATFKVDPNTYVGNRLQEMGVQSDKLNSAPVSMQNGTGDYQNIGSYGGNANIYGRAKNGSGKMNDFVGVGSDSTPSSSAPSFGGWNGGGGGPGGQGGYGGGGGPGAGQQGPKFASIGSDGADGSNPAGAINKHYNDLLANGRGKNVVNGADWAMRHGTGVEQGRSAALTNLYNTDANNATSMANNAATNATSRANNAQTTAAQMYDAQMRAQLGAAELGLRRDSTMLERQIAAQRLKYEMGKDARAQRETGVKDVNDAISKMFVNGKTKNGESTYDGAKQEEFRNFLWGTNPKINGRAFSDMDPQERLASLDTFRHMKEMQDARNNTANHFGAAAGGWGSEQRFSAPDDVSHTSFDDVMNHNLPLSSYLWERWVPGTNPNVVHTEDGQAVPYVEYVGDGNGGISQDKQKILSDALRSKNAQRSALRSSNDSGS